MYNLISFNFKTSFISLTETSFSLSTRAKVMMKLVTFAFATIAALYFLCHTKGFKDYFSNVNFFGKDNTPNELQRFKNLSEKIFPHLISKERVAFEKQELEKFFEKEQMAYDLKKETSFERDFKRGMAFKTKDIHLNIDDKKPLPEQISTDLKGEKADEAKTRRFERGVSLINNLIIDKKDDIWKPLIQAAVTQATYNSLLVDLFTELQNHKWKVGYQEYIFYSNNPVMTTATELEIIRNSNDLIKEVKVSLSCLQDLLRKNVGGSLNNEEDKVLKEKAFQASLNYVLSLDQNFKPVITEISFNYLFGST